MAVYVTGQVGKVQDWTLDNGTKGLTLHVLDIGSTVRISTDDPDLMTASRSVAKGAKITVPVEVKLSTFGGNAKLSYSMQGAPRVDGR